LTFVSVIALQACDCADRVEERWNSEGVTVVAWTGLAPYDRIRSGPGDGSAGTATGAAGEAVVLVADGPHRRRLIAALEGAGYRVSVTPRAAARQAEAPPARRRPAVRRTPVLVTDDTDAAARLRAEALAASPDTGYVVLVADPDPARYRQLLASGTSALPSDSTDDDVVLAVEAATRAFACLPVTAVCAAGGADGDPPAVSRREVSWLRALSAGETVAGVARTAGYSQREMYRLLRDLYGRLGADNRTEALLRADRLGLLAAPADGGAERWRVPAQRDRAGDRRAPL
jgi:DNA-binding NarL/FixJ family response regulator